MQPENREELISKLTEEQKSMLQGALWDMERDLGIVENPKDILQGLRKTNTKLYAALMGTPLENVEPFSTIMHQISELGVISRTEGGQPRPPEFDKDKLLEAIAQAKNLVG